MATRMHLAFATIPHACANSSMAISGSINRTLIPVNGGASLVAYVSFEVSVVEWFCAFGFFPRETDAQVPSAFSASLGPVRSTVLHCGVVFLI